MRTIIHKGGGLRLTAANLQFRAAPLLKGANISWTNSARVGDDQGRSNACSCFGLGSVAEIIYGKSISNGDALDRYKWALRHFGLPDAGLYTSQAWEACKGWFPGFRKLVETDSLESLKDAPMVVARWASPVVERASKTGMAWNAPKGTKMSGPHLMALIGKGTIPGYKGLWVTDENSWGLRHGYKGMHMLSEELHIRTCLGLWRLA